MKKTMRYTSVLPPRLSRSSKTHNCRSSAGVSRLRRLRRRERTMRKKMKMAVRRCRVHTTLQSMLDFKFRPR